MNKNLICSFLSITCMAGVAYGMESGTLQLDRKLMLLKTTSPQDITVINFDSRETLNQGAKQLLAFSLTAIDDAVTIDDTDQKHPKLTIDYAKTYMYFSTSDSSTSSPSTSSSEESNSPVVFRQPLQSSEDDSLDGPHIDHQTLGRKQELLKTCKSENIIITGYHAEDEKEILAMKETILESLASVDNALSIDDTDPYNPKLIVDLSHIVTYPFSASPAQVNLHTLAATHHADITLWKGTQKVKATITEKEKVKTWIIQTVKAVELRDAPDGSGGILGVDLDKLPQQKPKMPEGQDVAPRSPQQPTLLQSLGIPVIKSAGLIGLGYLLATYGSSK